MIVSPIFGLAKRLRDQLAIVLEPGVRRRRHDRDDLVLVSLSRKRAHLVVLHRLVDEMDVEQRRPDRRSWRGRH